MLQTKGQEGERMAGQVPVVIVGAGPVGLVSALRLARNGVPSIVLEAADDFPVDLRASTFHPPTLDFLADLGVGDTFVAMGEKAPTWQILDVETGRRAVFDLSLIAPWTRHPYRLQCEQYKLTPVLYEAAKATGLVDLRFGCKVVEVSQTADRAVAHVETNGERQRIEGDWLIGSDGAHSVVRKSLGLSLEGDTYPSVTILVTTPFPFDRHIPNLAAANYLWTRTDSGSLFRLPGEWRATFYPREGETDDDSMLAPEAINERLQALAPSAEGYAIREIRAYKIHKRIVPNYRIGRVMLAGDAAHLNAPTGGMGMNGGIHDAMNLTEKLLQVMAGASPDLLDLYTRQRRPVAYEEIIQQADANRKRMEDRTRRDEILADMNATIADRDKHVAWLLKSSMIEGLRRAAAIQ
jgi:2-polyprenyl-6-methoxyphenol hydroxylase-like FAD-dependent oxidoreductase